MMGSRSEILNLLETGYSELTMISF